MPLPYRIATLLYGFHADGRVLLMRREREPNQGLFSPPGGKLQTDTGESPHTCAIREAREEIALSLQPTDLHLTGVISEHGYEDQAHWLMFLFEIEKPLVELPPDQGYYRHVGIYAYRVSYLLDFVEREPSSIERTESLEQLRALYHGGRIVVAPAVEKSGPGVDTETDLEKVRKMIGT